MPFSDLLNAAVKDGDVRAFLNERELTSVGMTQGPEEYMLEVLLRT